MKRVFIAEKPDIANAMAEYIWGVKAKANKTPHYYKGGDTIVTWAFGHILQQFMPEDYGEQYKSFSTYPVIPTEWKKKISPSAKEQFKAIKELLKTADVVVNGGDPDREGQLLVDEILDYVGYKGKVERILINAKDNDSLKRAFDNIEPNEKYHQLYEAGMGRERGDWLVGMNLSRAYTINAQKHGVQAVWRIGRVKTPTLALVVNRENEIQNFRSVKYYKLNALFNKDGIDFSASYVIGENDPQDSEGRIVDKVFLENTIKQIAGRQFTVSLCEKKEETKYAPLPYSLDTLQTDANKKYGISPDKTLATVQSLYEKKFVSYPRSDCNYIPVAQHSDAPKILSHLKDNSIEGAGVADPRLKSKGFDTSKISAHHAIIPTSVKATGLSDIEQRIYNLIAMRYVIQFLPPCKSDVVKYTLVNGQYKFAGSGKCVTSPGWTKICKDDSEKKDDVKLPSLVRGEVLMSTKNMIEEKNTQPPSRFTEGTLLQAMTTIWKFVSSDNPYKDKLKDCKGIGTPATRATIISELLESKPGSLKACLKKEGKNLVPTDFGKALIGSIDQTLTKPDFTAVMELKLSEVATGKASLQNFEQNILSLVQKNIEFAETKNYDDVMGTCKTSCVSVPKLKCPVCGNQSLERKYSQKTKNNFWICNDKNCVHPITKKPMFYSEHRNKPQIGLCPDCRTVMELKYSKKTGKSYWFCPKCNGFKNDYKKYN